MVNNSHQYQQSEQLSLNSDGQQFHKYQKREQSHFETVMGNNSTNINKPNKHF
jgi:hypothetical protein